VDLSPSGMGKRDGLDESLHLLPRYPLHVGKPHPCSSRCSLLHKFVPPQKSLGFPNDLIRDRPLPHLTAFLSSLWRLLSKVKTRYCGGWRSVPIHPLPFSDSWPRVGIGVKIPRNSETMDSKGKSSKWDH
jgi:hypothetical protein